MNNQKKKKKKKKGDQQNKTKHNTTQHFFLRVFGVLVSTTLKDTIEFLQTSDLHDRSIVGKLLEGSQFSAEDGKEDVLDLPRTRLVVVRVFSLESGLLVFWQRGKAEEACQFHADPIETICFLFPIDFCDEAQAEQWQLGDRRNVVVHYLRQSQQVPTRIDLDPKVLLQHRCHRHQMLDVGL